MSFSTLPPLIIASFLSLPSPHSPTSHRLFICGDCPACSEAQHHTNHRHRPLERRVHRIGSVQETGHPSNSRRQSEGEHRQWAVGCVRPIKIRPDHYRGATGEACSLCCCFSNCFVSLLPTDTSCQYQLTARAVVVLVEQQEPGQALLAVGGCVEHYGPCLWSSHMFLDTPIAISFVLCSCAVSLLLANRLCSLCVRSSTCYWPMTWANHCSCCSSTLVLRCEFFRLRIMDA